MENGNMNRKPSQQSDRMSIASGRSGQVFAETGQKMLMRKKQQQIQDESDYDVLSNHGGSGAYTNSHRGDPQQMMLDVSY